MTDLVWTAEIMQDEVRQRSGNHEATVVAKDDAEGVFIATVGDVVTERTIDNQETAAAFVIEVSTAR